MRLEILSFADDGFGIHREKVGLFCHSIIHAVAMFGVANTHCDSDWYQPCLSGRVSHVLETTRTAKDCRAPLLMARPLFVQRRETNRTKRAMDNHSDQKYLY